MSSSYLEREVKLRFDAPESARLAVQKLDATPLRPRRLQSDVVYDTPDRTFAARAEVLRVRLDADRHYVTFKRPLEHPTMKLREEIETAVGDGRRLMTILERLGLVVAFRYEKYREEFTVGDCTVAIDETPVGTFLEVEGSDQGIMAITAALGRQPQEFVLESYRTLFLQACAANGVAATDMVFSR